MNAPLRLFRLLLPAITAALCFGGCWKAPPNISHIVLAHKSGTAVDPATLREFDSFERYAEHLDAMMLELDEFSADRADEEIPIVIYAQGGLLPMKRGIRNSSELHPAMTADGVFPIFINWESSFFWSYWDYLWGVRGGHRERHWGFSVLLPYLVVHDAVSTLIRAPYSIFWMFYNDSKALWPVRLESPINSWRPEGPVLAAIEFHRELARRYAENASDEIAVEYGDYRMGAGVRSARFAGYLLTLPFKVLAVPVIDVVGGRVWSMMKRRTATQFRSDIEQSLEVRRRTASYRPPPQEDDLLRTALDTRPTGVTSIFIERLIEQLEAQPPGRRYKVTLIGYSMGTIIMNELIARYGERFEALDNCRVDAVVYMGAACSVRDLELHIVPFLRDHPGTTFHNLCLHPTAEINERPGSVMGAIGLRWISLEPRGSLLAWIDNYYEHPLSPMHSTAGRWLNITQNTHIFNDVRSQVTLKTFGVGDSNGDPAFPEGNPQRHPEFDDPAMKFWRREFREVGSR